MRDMSSSPEYVLIAEAHSGTASAIARAVAAALPECTTVVAPDGSIGHDILAKRGIPRLMIADLALPKRDGFSLIRGLRKYDRDRRVKVIALSSFPALRKSATDLAQEIGPLSVVAKPLVNDALAAAVRVALAAPANNRPGPPLHAATPMSAFTPSMRPPALPAETIERQRLARLEEMDITQEAPNDGDLQRIVEEVAAEFSVPTALVSIVLEGKQWFKSYVGLGGELLANRGSARAYSFCTHVVEGKDALVVADAQESPTFKNNPFVLDGTVGGYAGAPIITPQGEVLGSLCIIDRKPLAVGAAEIARLSLVARRVAGELELSAARRRRDRLALGSTGPSRTPSMPPTSDATGESRRVALECLAMATSSLASGVVVFGPGRRALFSNVAFSRIFELREGELIGARREVILSRLSEHFLDASDGVARLAAPDDGPFALCEEIALNDGRTVRWTATPVDLPGGAIQIMSADDVTFG